VEREPSTAPADGNLTLPEGLLGAALSLIKEEMRLDVRVTWSRDAVEIQNATSHVVLVATADLASNPLAPYMELIANGDAGVMLLGPLPQGLRERLPANAVITPVEVVHPDTFYFEVQDTLLRVAQNHRSEQKSLLLSQYRYELSELIAIARAITQERNIDRLLHLILEKSRFITGADAGSIYVVEGHAADVRRRTLHFKLSQNESISFEPKQFTMPVSTRSIAGASVITRSVISIPDVYLIPANAPYGFDRSFDEKFGYRTGSMITMPMVSAADEVIGVIQLINKKKNPHIRLQSKGDFEEQVVPFDQRSEDLLATLASQAGIALENAMLYQEIQTIFEGFVRASVQAIEQRDPTTSGHSLRVSVLSCGLADAVTRTEAGPHAGTRFTARDVKELEYASLLHDFGKIGVREQVLVKAKKLYPHQLDSIRARFDYVQRGTEIDVLKRKIELMREGSDGAALLRLDEEMENRKADLERAWAVIRDSNEPTVLKQGDFTRIADIGGFTYVDSSGLLQPLLTPDEIASLQVTRGSLSSKELDEIRSHVSHTYNFLARIPWGKSYSRIPEIAGSHHEKLNGTGYPNRLNSEEIPAQSKIMSIADIYDALTARDRPYKKALPFDRALDILGFEVRDGHIDGELVRIFIEAQIFKEVERDLSY
jgi:HD-GYP domain-containing protein (c-di-GMP phosphodiesterase class II)